MAGYKHPCVYCDKLVPPDARICPFCGKADPAGPIRCPVCRNPIEKGWKLCSHCGLPLWITCQKCGKETFLEIKCESCGAPFIEVCPNPKCKIEQPPFGAKCVKCGKPLR
ncbi:hypothetical protein CUJ83_06310 [Methanocella sp. CWC-04]|uniref:DZANK-type domain-containing protein n=1 Tax=Methanooceanicella nereidis TaxID=2052831 RepID=A0AAP2W5X5_9EURY|nr:zinc ribbon domain-containing protein [Methanocella sp. CWC-04]MCD1294612.1 hypothetical protein [Methanocella sp. CWC-04]